MTVMMMMMMMMMMMVEMMVMMMWAFDFALMEDAFFALLCLSLKPTLNGIFTSSVNKSSKSGDARFGIGWTTAVAGATDEAIR